MKYLELTQGKRAIVDDDLYGWLSKWKWYYKKGYAARNQGGETVRMHRVINGTPEGMFTDHINGDKLDNRRINLRNCTRQENGANQGKHANNTSGYKGVYWHKRDRLWRVQLRINGKKTYLGGFKKLEDAVKTAETAVVKYHGSFAHK